MSESQPTRPLTSESPVGEATSPANDTAPRLIAGRYRVERSLGAGGMAEVFQVVDAGTQKHLALKQLHPNSSERGRAASTALFQREFHTLAQLAHPGTIQVYDYGIDGGAPYYTMECLDGDDLRALAPIPWERATALLRDVASALSLIHSRRLVHRDVSPRNIRCTSDGRAKLIDFGALTVMGPSSQIVGTAACAAPEVANLQPLDGRADLFSLGASFYFALTGRYPFPARDFQQARDAWRTRPPLPSELVPDIPPALDALIGDLLRLEAEARPQNAMEVIERASTIAQLPYDDTALVSQAYLATPTLVGRESELAFLAKQARRAARRRGQSVAIVGASGLGRSRLLDAAALEGKLAGCVVARADATDTGPFGVASALLRRLLAAAPGLEARMAPRQRAVLSQLHPELLEGCLTSIPRVEYSDAAERRAAIVATFRDWLLAVTLELPVLLAVDDVDRIDEPSQALLALLGEKVRRRGLLIVLSTQPEDDRARESEALRLIHRQATSLALQPLDGTATTRLLASVFGDVPNLEFVAQSLHRTAAGSPLTAVTLAQHLVDRGAIRYAAGGWSLPDTLDPSNLPPSIAQAFVLKLQALSEPARQLAQAMALRPEFLFSFDECAALTPDGEAAQAAQALDALVAAGAVKPIGSSFGFSQPTWSNTAAQLHVPEELPELHQRMARAIAMREAEGLRETQHWFAANDAVRAVDVAVAYSRETRELTDRDPEAFARIASNLPANWEATMTRAIDACLQQRRPRSDLLALLLRVSGMAPVVGVADPSIMARLMGELARAVGLDLFPGPDEAADPGSRLQLMFARAQARFDGTPEHDRTLPPLLAMQPLGKAIMEATATFADSIDFDLHDHIPDLAPLLPLSAALKTVQDMARAAKHRAASQVELGLRSYAEIVERLNQPDRAGLEATHQRFATLAYVNALAVLEAGLGLDSALVRAEAIESSPMLETSALRIRLIHALWQGDARTAEAFRRKLELLQIERKSGHWNATGHLLRELAAYALCDDLTRVKQLVEELDPIAERFRHWLPVHAYALGEYHRIRGDRDKALEHFERALSAGPAGRSHAWPYIAGSTLHTLLLLGRSDETLARGEALLAQAREAQFDLMANPLRLQLALAHAQSGSAERARAHLEDTRVALEVFGVAGLHAAMLHEATARIAIALGDPDAFEAAMLDCAQSMNHGRNRGLAAKYERLVQEAVVAGLRASAQGRRSAIELSFIQTALTSALEDKQTREERALAALELLVQHSGASGGALYLLAQGGPERVAVAGDVELPLNLDALAAEHLQLELGAEGDITSSDNISSNTGSVAHSEWTCGTDACCHPMLLGHGAQGHFAVTGLVVLVERARDNYQAPNDWLADLSLQAARAGDATAVIVQ